MFIETHKTYIGNEEEGTYKELLLTFLKSIYVQAYPCGRRRSTFIEHDLEGDGNLERFQFPFDPEARLNTEANNRKHSGLNGYTQTYLVSDWHEPEDSTEILNLALNGYLFNIKLDTGYKSANTFGNSIITELKDEEAEYIYANIIVEDLKLFSSKFKEYFTGVLRDQAVKTGADGYLDNTPSEALDLLKSGTSTNADKDARNYYFSGLSFSTRPLTSLVDESCTGKTRSVKTNSFTYLNSKETANQIFVSLCILEKSEGIWKIHEPARLPFIEHGETANSIVVGDTLVECTSDNPGNLTVEGNVEVGKTDGEGALISGTGDITAKNNITAKKDITAENDIHAKNDLRVDNNATVTKTLTVKGTTLAKDNVHLEKNLDVGTVDGDGEVSEGTGTITAKTLVKTPKVEVTAAGGTGLIEADNITINQALGAPSITVDETLTVKDELIVKVKNEDGSDKLDNNNNPIQVTITDGTIEAYNILKNPDGEDINNIHAYKAAITTLNTNNLTIANEATSPEFTQVIDRIGRPVPWIHFEKQSDNTWQLQISRVTTSTDTVES